MIFLSSLEDGGAGALSSSVTVAVAVVCALGGGAAGGGALDAGGAGGAALDAAGAAPCFGFLGAAAADVERAPTDTRAMQQPSSVRVMRAMARS